MEKQDPKKRKRRTLKPIEKTGKEFLQRSRVLSYRDQESCLLMHGLQATHKLRGLNVDVKKITKLHQGPNQHKGAKSRKEKKTFRLSIIKKKKKKGGKGQTH